MQAINNTKGHLEKINENLSAVLKDIENISSYMIYSEDIRAYLKTPKNLSNWNRLTDLEDRINGFAIFHLTSKFYLHSISLMSNYYNQIHIGIYYDANEQNEKLSMEKAKERMGKVYWSDVYTVKDQWKRENKVMSLFRVINDINNVSLPLGMVVIRVDLKKIYDYIETDFRDLEKMFVISRNGTVVMHANSTYIGRVFPDQKILQEIRKHDHEPITLSYQKQHTTYHVVTQPVDGTDLVIIGFVNEASIAEGITGMQKSIRFMMIVLTLLGFMAMLGFYHFNIKRIQDLIKQTHQVEKGDLTASVTVKHKDEIGLLGIRFNKMVTRLRNLIENEYQMEIKNRESELKLLQSQINPHFLYNTLDMIRWTARLEQAMETSKLIEQLSKMFRISLNRGKILITIQDELSYSQSYLELQKRRLGNTLEFYIFCDHEALQAIVLKQMIQPLIENSINHGFENMRALKKIYIRCFKENSYLIIDVMDNGKGFSNEQFEMVTKKGYALKNIHDRLKIAFGNEAQIEIKQKADPGAWVRITLPFKEKEDDVEVIHKCR
ncbi:two-component system sensor histidine kinase YesM [Anoxybacillus tepidamans]|uniref:Two-component system sensor histidine kinase YesM n=1 Tax=Anoxybacteroides tepidamans TaxID=265948 RepID=A0A7W8IS79_9BACL|nr:sensor histidine kinase [Anoxybacillus tepidamans]MBB5325743.1 two-component system sensor histidine kinase YesM [Anoxybacillus tepidamans]